MRKSVFVLLLIVLPLVFPLDGMAQFKNNAFSQQYNDDKPGTQKDSVDVMFSFPEFFRGLAHKDTLKIGNMFAGSMIFVGSSQIYNSQYWKLPIVYGGIGAGLGVGLYYNKQFKQSGLQKDRTASTLGFVGAGLFYWGALMDGVICYKPDFFPHPGKATIYSILVPGLGQIYNKEYWKVPIYVGGMAAAYHFYNLNRINYERFRNIYKELTDEGSVYHGPSNITAQTALYYRDVYRRYRDYSVLALAAVYLLQIIDANVFSFMHDFNVSDDLAFRLEPAVIGGSEQFAFNPPQQGLGLRLGFSF